MFYLEDKKMFVKNTENFVYMINGFQAYDNCEYIRLHLELVSGWDYVNPDENDMQGWCNADRFIEDIQDEYIYQYFLHESMEQCLVENDYVILKNINSSLQKIIDKHLEEKYKF